MNAKPRFSKILLFAALAAITLISPVASLRAGPGYALSFNGSSGYLAARIPAMASNYTISAWAYVRAGGDFHSTRLGLLTGTNCGNSVEVLIRSTTASVYDPQFLELGRCGNFSGQTSKDAVPLLQWVHLTISVATNKAVSFYLDGKPSGTVTNDNYDTPLGPNIHLGDNALRKFDGALDEVRIWNRALGEEEIRSTMHTTLTGSEPGLVAYWRFENVATNSATMTGSASDGSLFNSPSYILSGAPFAPDATPATATDVGVESTTLSSLVNPGNLATAAWFEWGADTNYRFATDATILPAENTVIAVTNRLKNLNPGGSYHARLVVSNSIGMVIGKDVTWTNLLLPPTVTTLSATEAWITNATLNATVNPNAQSTRAWFEWGTDTTYNHRTPIQILPASPFEMPLSQLLTGLIPKQTYHFRLVASNVVGVALGADMAFTTPYGTNTVTTLADSGEGSLRQAIANSTARETILFATNGTITLTSGELVIDRSLNFVGPGATNLAISGNNNSRVFHISNPNATVVLSDVTICDGQAGVEGDGGGIYNVGNLTLHRCIVTRNRAGKGGDGGNGGNGNYYNDGGVGGVGGTGGRGGGVYNAGSLTLSACTCVYNTAGPGGSGGNGGTGGTSTHGGKGGKGGSGGTGGGVYSAGSLTLSACTVASNAGGTAGIGGTGGTGGNSVMGGNGGNGGDGGGGGHVGGVLGVSNLEISECTIVNNSAGTGGPGGYAGYPGPGGGSFGTGGTGGMGGSGGGLMGGGNPSFSRLRNCLLAQNTVGPAGPAGNRGGSPGSIGSDPDISGAFMSQGHNFIRLAGSATGFIGGLSGDIVGNVDPGLGALGDYGGPTPTVALLPGSLAIDAGDDSLGSGADQRGLPRKSGRHVDIGAYELQLGEVGASGYALYLNGTRDQYVTVPDQDWLTFTNAFTWEAWINVTKTAWVYFEEWATILGKDRSTEEYWFSIFQDGKLDTRGAQSGFTLIGTADSAIPFQKWQHVAVTWDGTMISYYVNGALKQTQPFSGTIPNTDAPLLIGRDGQNRLHFTGYLDEVRLWNMARSQSQIASTLYRPVPGSEPGLVACWNFDEGSGLIATNSAQSTGSAGNGQLVNSPMYLPSTIPFLPNALTLAASAVGAASATLHATVYPNNLDTTVWFEWGADTNYGHTTATNTVAAASSSLVMETLLAGLSPGQTYHFRIVASNAGGVARGKDMIVTTTSSQGLNLSNCNFNPASRVFSFSLSGSSGQNVVVETCTTLTSPVWLSVQTNTLNGSATTLSIANPSTTPQRYYRVRRL